MEAQNGVTELATLRQHWRKWTAIVERFARRCRERHWLHAEEYQRLYKELIGSCRSLAGTADEAQEAFYQRLESLAQPWLTCQVLEKADREILLDLLERCQQIQKELSGRMGVSLPWRWKTPVFALAAAGAVLFLLIWTADWVWFPLLGWLKEAWQEKWNAIAKWSAAQQLIVAGFTVSLIAMCLVWHRVRSR
jgi:hypothetical protein